MGDCPTPQLCVDCVHLKRLEGVMADHFAATIQAVVADIEAKEAEVRRQKQLVNLLCEQAGQEPRYTGVDEQPKSSALQFRGDEFFNQPLNRAIRNYLDRRHKADLGPATPEQILEALIAGGYDGFSENEAEALNSLKISLGKSSHTFVKLQNGKYGIKDWYGPTKVRRRRRLRLDDDHQEDEDEDVTENGEEEADSGSDEEEKSSPDTEDRAGT